MSEPPRTFEMRTEARADGVTILAVSGELDLFTAPRLRDALHGAAEASVPMVVVDLSDATFLDSTALGVIIAGVKALRPHDGRLAVVNTNRAIARTLAITGLDRALTVGDSVPSVLGAVRD